MLSHRPPANSYMSGAIVPESTSPNGGDQSTVLRKIIGDLGVLEGEATASNVKKGIANQRRQLIALLRTEFKIAEEFKSVKSNVQKKWRKAVTGDETKRVRDHIR